MAIKRLHYYNQQFLVEADFTDEQKYHLDMRRRLSKVLHTFGIAEGLDVQRTGNRQVTVRAGTAVDSSGREMVLEADQIVDLSNLTTFPASTTVFVTIAYQEAQTDPSTATGAPGNTRFTEAPLVQASTTAPPTDGTVVRLARFDKTTAGDVPGNPNDLLDGGVRQSVSAKIAPGAITDVNLAAGAVSEAKLAPALATKINAPSGLVSVDGVSNPGGNVDLVPGGAITLAPNNATRQIVISETHSTRVDNPHATTAAQVGAMALSQYDLRLRSTVVIAFTQADANGAIRTVPFGFQPRVVFSLGNCSAVLSGRTYGGGSTGIFDIGTGLQRCCAFAITKVSNAPPIDWFIRNGGGVPDAGICSALFFDSSTSQAESLVVTVSTSPTVLTATLARVPQSGLAALPNFTLSINLFCWGS